MARITIMEQGIQGVYGSALHVVVQFKQLSAAIVYFSPLRTPVQRENVEG